MQLSRAFGWSGKLRFADEAGRAPGDLREAVSDYFIVDTTLISRGMFSGLENLELRLSVYNLFDEEYADPAPLLVQATPLQGDYPQPGRRFLFEVANQF
jgi:outer membrane receptor protein involved in Fe transport